MEHLVEPTGVDAAVIDLQAVLGKSSTGKGVRQRAAGEADAMRVGASESQGK